MAGLSDTTPIPSNIELHTQSRTLVLQYESGEAFVLSHEMLRVFTPSAEARGHGVGQEVLQTGKREVYITEIEGVGNYAIRPVFSDGHDTGIYSWDLLYNLGKHQAELWQAYLEQLEKQGGSREPSPVVQHPATAHTKGCGSGGCGSGGCSTN